MVPQYARALADIHAGFTDWLMWGRLGWMEIRRRYRRTVLGPFWTTANMAIMIFSIGYLWAALFSQPVTSYLPYLSAGIIVWQFMTSCMTEGAVVFTGGAGLITTIRIPKFLLVITMVWRNILVFFHNLVVFFVIVVLWQLPVNWNTLLAIPGLLLLALNEIWLATLLGIVCTRFRDVPQLLTGFLNILLFLTPVMWSRDLIKGREAIAYIIDYNPFFHALELVRAPLLGQAPTLANWAVMGLMLPLGTGLMLYVFSRFRQRVAYWL